MRTRRLVLHVGVRDPAFDVLRTAVAGLARQLSRRAVRVVDGTSWRVPGTPPGEVGARLAALGRENGTLLCFAEPLPPEGAPQYLEWLAGVLASRDLGEVTVMLHTRRQDLLAEFAYLQSLEEGGHDSFGEFLAARRPQRIDYLAVLDDLVSTPRVDAVRVRPYELLDVGADTFVADFVASSGLPDRLDLRTVRALPMPRVYSERGVAVATALNQFLDTPGEAALVREFLMGRFGTEPRRTALLRPDERVQVLEAHASCNAELFRRHMPDLAHDSYFSGQHTRRMAVEVADRYPAAQVRSGWIRSWRRRMSARRPIFRPRSQHSNGDGSGKYDSSQPMA